MSRKQKPPPKKPSKAYLVSFGDTMTALLAFFIVLNSFASDQTGAQMHAGTGSFIRSSTKTGSAGGKFGDRSGQNFDRKGHTPVYAVAENDPANGKKNGSGADNANDSVINRQAENFQRFLNEMNYRFDVTAESPTQSQIVFDSFEKFGADKNILGPNAIQLASDAFMSLSDESFELEVIVWATMPSEFALKKSTELAKEVESQLFKSFSLSGRQRQRFSVSAQPWLFVDAARPKVSFVLSRIDR